MPVAGSAGGLGGCHPGGQIHARGISRAAPPARTQQPPRTFCDAARPLCTQDIVVCPLGMRWAAAGSPHVAVRVRGSTHWPSAPALELPDMHAGAEQQSRVPSKAAVAPMSLTAHLQGTYEPAAACGASRGRRGCRGGRPLWQERNKKHMSKMQVAAARSVVLVRGWELDTAVLLCVGATHRHGVPIDHIFQKVDISLSSATFPIPLNGGVFAPTFCSSTRRKSKIEKVVNRTNYKNHKDKGTPIRTLPRPGGLCKQLRRWRPTPKYGALEPLTWPAECDHFDLFLIKMDSRTVIYGQN